MTSKPWLIVNEDKKSCNNNKNLSQNQLQNLSPIPKTHKVPDNIYLIFAMHKFNNWCNACYKSAGLKPPSQGRWNNELFKFDAW